MKRSLIVAFIMFWVTFPELLFAAQMPRFLGSEKKFRSYIYNPNDVYRYIGHYTYQGFIEFEQDEVVNTISMGDPTLWLFEHKGNRLFLKPVGEDNSETNMTVITNKRVYHFELMAKEAKGITDEDLIFVIRFLYPNDKDKNIVQFPKSAPSDIPDLRDLSKYNFAYQYTGEKVIAPLKVFDNGEFTYFKFSEKNAELPAIFSVDANGYESLVNFRSAGDYIIVEKVASQFTLRNGSDIVCVYNSGMYKDNYNSSGGIGGQPLIPNSPPVPSYAAPAPIPQVPQAPPAPISELDVVYPGDAPPVGIGSPASPSNPYYPPGLQPDPNIITPPAGSSAEPYPRFQVPTGSGLAG